MFLYSQVNCSVYVFLCPERWHIVVALSIRLIRLFVRMCIRPSHLLRYSSYNSQFIFTKLSHKDHYEVPQCVLQFKYFWWSYCPLFNFTKYFLLYATPPSFYSIFTKLSQNDHYQVPQHIYSGFSIQLFWHRYCPLFNFS